MKINSDAAYTPGDNIASWGVVVRNQLGEVVTARAGKMKGVADAFGAEVYAMWPAPDTAAGIGAIRVVFETDKQLLGMAPSGQYH